MLTALKMELSLLVKKTPGNQKPTIDAAIDTVQRICQRLRPGLLDDLGLTAAMEWQAAEFERRTGIVCKASFRPSEIAFDRERSTMIFRIFQEALTNAARHSGATEVAASVREEAGGVTLRVSDNGRGITDEEIRSPQSIGLIGMRERALSLAGHMEIEGVPGQGTMLTVRIPRERRKSRGDPAAARG